MIVLKAVRKTVLRGSAVLLLVAGAACGSGEASESSVADGDGQKLIGVFAADAGTCKGKKVTGSYMRMVNPGGEVEKGPYVDNADSSCADGTYTPFVPGDDGGLSTIDFQPAPNPIFDKDGNALATSIMEPQGFYGVKYSISTDPTDLQTEESTTKPVILIAPDGTLTGDLGSWTVSWNGQHFNQGAPKPDGSQPGLTTIPTGTYDEATGKFTLDWASRVVGGPFDSFTGVWHLEGTFEEGKA